MESIDIFEFADSGYKPIVDYDQWRVATLKYCEELEIRNIKMMQKHDETDEVFVLLAGACILFSGSDKEIPTKIAGIRMKPFTIYNVKRGVWHTHTLDKHANVLIVENRNTSDQNSPVTALTDAQLAQVNDLFYELSKNNT